MERAPKKVEKTTETSKKADAGIVNTERSIKKRAVADVEPDSDFDAAAEVIDVDCLPPELKKQADANKPEKSAAATLNQYDINQVDVCESTPKAGGRSVTKSPSDVASTSSSMWKRAKDIETASKAVPFAFSPGASISGCLTVGKLFSRT